jgi:predicted dehydrogenase
MNKLNIGIVGCGAISGIYLKNCTGRFQVVNVAACADIIPERAQEKAKEYGVAKACSVDELLADPDVHIVLNLTIPKVHAEVCVKALEAGKHAYVEKPLAVSRADGTRVLDTAKAKGLRVGGAPDTFLGGGIQTCRKLIEDGWVGRPVGATAFMLGAGHESWHPDPEFYYKAGGGPMFDMGPYYLTALVFLLGPINRIAGLTRTTFSERLITSEPKYGTTIAVDVPTHVAGLMDFHSGAVGTIITSFDIRGGHNLPRIEVYGTEGTLMVPDPNTFGGPVMMRRAGQKEWKEVPLSHGYADNSRGIGVADMAYGILSGRPHRANGELTYHVLEAMHAFHDASDSGQYYSMQSTCEQPAPLPLHLTEGMLDP